MSFTMTLLQLTTDGTLRRLHSDGEIFTSVSAGSPANVTYLLTFSTLDVTHTTNIPIPSDGFALITTKKCFWFFPKRGSSKSITVPLRNWLSREGVDIPKDLTQAIGQFQTISE